jgi:ABC-type transport system substrate-binding protein
MMPMQSNFNKILLLFAVFAVFAYSCGKSTETTVVRTTAITVTPDLDDADEERSTLSPQKIRIGEYQDFEGFDPLFAQNSASQRVIQLLYSGLTRIDAEGNVLPALAESWSVSEDSLSYTFKIRPNARFGDSPVFVDGQGRKILSTDVAFNFLRMTNRNVPPTAANMFSQVIYGMDAYNREQREVYLQQNRRLNTIEGIQIVDEATIEFTLTSKTPYFTELLANPFASIYPREALQNLQTRPVGSGPYRLNQFQADSLFTLVRSNSYFIDGNGQGPSLLEFHWFTHESSILRALARNRIDFVPDLPPVSRAVALDSRGSIYELLKESFNFLETTGNDYIGLYFNDANIAGFSAEEGQIAVNLILADSLTEAQTDSNIRLIKAKDRAKNELVSVIGHQLNESSLPTSILMFSDRMYDSFIARTFFDLSSQRLPVILIQSHVVSREMTWYLRYNSQVSSTFDAELHPLDDNELARFSTPRFSVFHKNIVGIRFNTFPWWMQFDGVSIENPTSRL